MEYKTAKTYANWIRVGEPFEKNKKMYQKAKTKCDRCGGLGLIASRVENGQIIPIPVVDGICFKCLGSKYIYKEVRLYTEEEYNKMELANEKARQKKAKELEIKMKIEFKEKKIKWLKDNGWSQDGVTYIVTGDSYSIKDDLKNAGWLFDYVLRWHKADPTGYEDRVKKVEIDKVIEFSAWGEGHYLTEAKDYIDNLLTEESADRNSQWVGQIGSRDTFNVTLVSKRGFQGRFGYSNVYTFRTEDGNILTWFSTVEVEKEPGDQFTLVGTVKDHTEYKNIKQTILSRCKIK